MKIATNTQVSQAISTVSSLYPVETVAVCDGCGEMHVCRLVDDEYPHCDDCLVRDVLAMSGLRRMSHTEYLAAKRAEVLNRMEQESAQGFGV